MENQEICSVCKGACCKATPGHIFPSELKFPVTLESLTTLLQTNLYAIAWWGDSPMDKREEATRLFYLRMRQVCADKILDDSKHYYCILLTEIGCKLPHDERPMVCRALIPKENFKCTFDDDSLTKVNCAIAWMPYQGIIKSVLKDFNEL